MTGPDDTGLRRLRLRSWRRGMREMDLILGRFADAELSRLPPGSLAAYEDLLSENDQDLYCWISGSRAAPEPLREIVGEIRRFHAMSPRVDSP